MLTVGIRELKQHTSKLIRKVRQEGSQIQVTYRGEVVALLVPVKRAAPQESSQAWADIDQLAAEIGRRWPAGVSAQEAVSEGRR